jgi:hypothetical protein
MASPYESILDQAMAEYGRQREQSGELYRQLNSVTETAVAARQVVRVTVGRQGEVTELTFPNAAYKNMTGVELSAVILKTIAQAHAQMRARAAELLAPSLPPGVSATDLMSGNVDLEALLPAVPRFADIVDEVPGGERA